MTTRGAGGPGVDYERVAGAYRKARTFSLEAIAPWRDAVAHYLADAAPLPALDVGAGTGWFANAFATWFGARMIAIEPSAAMRHEAQASAHPLVTHVGGRAENLPLRERVGGWAWLSTVIHHIADLPACARELRRVLAPGGRVFIRSAFPGRHEHVTLFRFFPAAAEIAETFPTVEATTRTFARSGFHVERLESVRQVSAPDLATFATHVRAMRHGDSTLARLDDETVARGLAALDAAAAAEHVAAPVVDRLDLLVFR
jgi:ubiquinone/menaquinone biosynthesis C-methylase UbiE